MDSWIFGLLLRKSTNLQGITLYIYSSPTPYLRIEKFNSDLQVDRWIFGFLLLFEKSTNLQGIANGWVDFWFSMLVEKSTILQGIAQYI